MPVFLSSSCFGISDLYAPIIRNIRFSGLTIRAQHNIIVQGNIGSAVENIVFRDVLMDMTGVPECRDTHGYGEWDYVTSSATFYIANAASVVLDGVQVCVEEEVSPISKAVITENAEVSFRAFTVKKGGATLTTEEGSG